MSTARTDPGVLFASAKSITSTNFVAKWNYEKKILTFSKRASNKVY